MKYKKGTTSIIHIHCWVFDRVEYFKLKGE